MSIALGLLTLVALLAVVWLLLACMPSVARAVINPTDGRTRNDALDGLRGLLALCVFLHHGIFQRIYSQHGVWQAPPGNFDNLLGQASVGLFFMLSAYLFWSQVLRRGASMNWRTFLVGRLHRLAPMYYTAVLLLFLIVAVESGFTLQIKPAELGKEILRWCSFALLGMPAINGLHNISSILSSAWTLRYEWIFYAALPVLSFIYLKAGHAWPVYLGLAAFSLHGEHISPVIFFAGGCIAAHLMSRKKFFMQKPHLWAIGGCAALISLGIWFHDMYGVPQALLLIPVFVAAVQGVGPWRILAWTPLRFMGRISYSFYLLHLPVLHIVTAWMFGYPAFAALGSYAFYASLLATGLGITFLSTLCFLALEKPFLPERQNVRNTREILLTNTLETR